MAELQALEVVVGSDITGLTKGMNSAQKELVKTSVAAQKLDSRLAKDLTKGSNTAAFALTNLGRVAQDAPFGFIGIQNNINPLLESFQRLRAEAGSNVGALKALASSLIGGAGIGLAVSLVTSALTVLAQNGFFKTKKAADEATNSVKEYKDALKGIVESVAKEAAQIGVLVTKLQEENLSRGQRADAIKQLQAAAPAYFNTLNAEKSTILDITNAYGAYTRSILKNIEAKVRQKELEDVTEQILKLQRTSEDLGTKQVLINGKLVTVSKQILNNGSETLSDAELYQATIRGTIGLTTEQNKELTKLKGTQSDLLKLVASDTDLAAPVIKDDKNKKAAKDLRTINDVLADLGKQIAFLNDKELVFKTDESTAKISAYFSTVETLLKDFKVDPNSTLIAKLVGLGTGFELGLLGKKLQDEITKELKKPIVVPPLIITQATETNQTENRKTAEAYKQGIIKELERRKIPFNPFDTVEGLEKTLADSLIVIDQFGSDLTAAVKAISVQAFAGFGQGIADVINGSSVGDAFGNLFSTLLESLGSGMQQLGTQAIAASKLIQLISATLATPAGIVAGVALVALGGVIKGLAAKLKVPAFANGVNNFIGGTALVGERGPELVTLPRGSNVIPNNQLSSISGGGGGQVFIPSIKLSGNDIYMSFKRTEQSRNRQG